MATILLSAAGAAAGAGFGGTVLGLSGAVIGRAVGATLGRVIDQRLMGSGSRAVETGRLDRFRLTGASEGAAVGILWGRMRVGGQIIWATRFKEHAATSGGGKGAPKPKVRSYSYTVSLAVALCEGEITRVGRIWADGVELAPRELNMRVYTGSADQMPDPKIEAVEGAGTVPAYRGIAYVVFEDLDLTPFGNRVPQFSFEVVRRAQGALAEAEPDLQRDLKAVAMIPGTGEFALGTTAAHLDAGLGARTAINVNTPAGGTDFEVSLRSLREELPGCGSVSLVVSWFGDDLRCGSCTVRPLVENVAAVSAPLWSAGGVSRATAGEVPKLAGRSVYGGTPSDRSVAEAIAAIRAGGQSVVFYPFILMQQTAGNGRADPWTGTADQPALPWRGRITTSVAAGRAGSPDGTAQAEAEVAAFFGQAQPGHFTVSGTSVGYSGPAGWGYRRFVLHYAHLCAAAGGVDAFCIGSEMRGLTQIRGADGGYPAVAALATLAAEVRAILGPGVKIGYAADWSEYRGHDLGGGDFRHHLDPLWAHPAIDFIGIDNYLPLADWREGQTHADAAAGSIYDLGYLRANVAGGEGYDWYYGSPEEKAAQLRTPITDGAYGEPWLWRVKDLRNWWERAHHDRLGGIRQAATAWVPGSKPIWFTEFGCAAIDKGANEPNRFLDTKSSESALPYGSTGVRDDLMQAQYLRATLSYWADPANNPVSPAYGGPMVDLSRAHAWCWDSRPYPWFPGNAALWSDGANYPRGHWLNGRVTGQPLSTVVAEICERAGLRDVDVSALYGIVRGYALGEVGTGRAALQPLMLAYGFEATESAGRIVFRMRGAEKEMAIGRDECAVGERTGGRIEARRAAEAEMTGRVRLSYVEADGDYDMRAVEAILPWDDRVQAVSQSEIALSMTRSEAQATAERWLIEAQIARDGVQIDLPPSRGGIDAGDVILLEGSRYRVDQVERGDVVALDCVRIEEAVYRRAPEDDEPVQPKPFAAPVPVLPLFLDLPLLTGDELPHAPHLAAAATPWPGTVDLYASDQDAGYMLNTELPQAAVIGQSLTALGRAQPALLDRGAGIRVRIGSGTLAAVDGAQLLNGANLIAIGDGSPAGWELLQFGTATLVAPGVYDLTMLLRGQFGTDATMPDLWPAGSWIVRVDGALRQIAMKSADRGLARHFRIGPASRGYDDPTYVHQVAAFDGLGLRPYAPCHLRAWRQGGDLAVNWVRRTRIDGDGWLGAEVPLGESSERYEVRIVKDATIRRRIAATTPLCTYPGAQQSADGVAAPFEVHVAQVSDVYGPGPFARILINE